MSTPLELYNEGYRNYEDHIFAKAIELYHRGLAASPSPGEEMILKFHLALAIWTMAGLEVEGKLESLNASTAPAAEEAMHYWEDVVNLYHQKVKDDPDENRRWPLPGASPDQMRKEAVGAAMKAGLALRVKKLDKASREEPESQTPDKAESGGCFIATAAYGSELAPEVMILRRFRDEVLLNSRLGTALVKFYYFLSPPLAFLVSEHQFLRIVTRVVLLEPILLRLKVRREDTRRVQESK